MRDNAIWVGTRGGVATRAVVICALYPPAEDKQQAWAAMCARLV